MTNQTHWTQWPETKLHELANWFYSLVTTPKEFTSQLEPFDDRTQSFFFNDCFHIKFRSPLISDNSHELGKKGILIGVPLEEAVYLYGLAPTKPNIVQAVLNANVKAAIDQAIFIPPRAHYPLYFFDLCILEDANEQNQH